MARTKAVLGSGARLTDYLSASLLARVYPAELVHELLNQYGCNTQRKRSFPAVAGVYYCMALSLYPEAAYEEVFAAVAQGLAWAARAAQPARVAKSSISALRTRIGAAPLKALHERACLPLADATTHPHAFYAGLRLMAIDGSHFEIADEARNVAAFGRPGSRTGFAAYPQAQCAVLVECATHAIVAAQLGAYRQAEWALCEPLLEHLTPDMLCLADQGFDGYARWQAAQATGAQLLWRCRVNRELPVITPLADGSYLSVLYPDVKSRRMRSGEVVVRVIDYALPGVAASTTGQKNQGRYRLLTTLLDPSTAPALELAQLYHQRWEVEAVFDELKTHLGQGRRTLRSKTPEGVEQEFYGWVLAHYAVCWLMHQANSGQRLAQRCLSFTGHVQLLRRAQPHSGVFSPSAAQTAGALVC